MDPRNAVSAQHVHLCCSATRSSKASAGAAACQVDAPAPAESNGKASNFNTGALGTAADLVGAVATAAPLVGPVLTAISGVLKQLDSMFKNSETVVAIRESLGLMRTLLKDHETDGCLVGDDYKEHIMKIDTRVREAGSSIETICGRNSLRKFLYASSDTNTLADIATDIKNLRAELMSIQVNAVGKGVGDLAAAVKNGNASLQNAIDAIPEAVQALLAKVSVTDPDNAGQGVLCPPSESRPPLRALSYDVFISYRTASDHDHAKLLAASLQDVGLSVCWDDGLTLGSNWESGFASGLASSRFFLPVVSRKAFSLKGREWTRLTEDSAVDFVLVEWRLALELQQRKRLEGIIPLLFGEVDPSNGAYEYWSAGSCAPSPLPSVAVRAVEAILEERMVDLTLGAPACADKSVAGTYKSVTAHRGPVTHGSIQDVVSAMVQGIRKAVSGLQVLRCVHLLPTGGPQTARQLTQHAKALVDALCAAGLKVWWDKNLPIGISPCGNALSLSRVFVPIVSRGALNAVDANGEPMRGNWPALTPDSDRDNLLFESRLAHELQKRDGRRRMLPLLLGDRDEGTGIYGNFIAQKCAPVFKPGPDVVVSKVESIVESELDRLGLGAPVRVKDGQRSVQAMWAAVYNLQYCRVVGTLDEIVSKAVEAIRDSVLSSKAQA